MFQQRHYEWLADKLVKYAAQRVLTGLEVRDIRAFAYYLADELANDNPSFKRDKFLKACGCIE